MAPYVQTSGVIKVSRSPEMPNWFYEDITYTLFKTNIFTVAALLKALAYTLSERGAGARPDIKSINVF